MCHVLTLQKKFDDFYSISQVFKTGSSFVLPRQKIQDFFNPEQKTVSQALTSPRKCKLTVEGEVAEVNMQLLMHLIELKNK